VVEVGAQRQRVGVTIHTSGLTPGTADTVWWVFSNNPAACKHGMFGARCGLGDVLTNPASLPSVQVAAGHVIGADGVGSYGAYFSADAAPDCAGFGLPWNGLLDAAPPTCTSSSAPTATRSRG
jgi:hypothetical protein